ncbi:MAG: CPBP family intramembrane glutamic endopeptidase [Bacilli bacterium]
MSKRKIIDYLLIFFLFIFLNTFPLSDLTNNPWIWFSVYCVMNVAFLIFLYFFVKKRSCLVTYPHGWRKKSLWLLLPLILVSASNFIYLFFVPSDVTSSLNWTFPLYVVLTVFTALKEEAIFRLLLIPNLDKVHHRFWRIILSSAIFGIAHLSNFLITFDATYLIQIVYTFGFGIILGFIYEYGRSYLMCVIFHFVFNTINGTIFETITPITTNFSLYIVINIVVSLVAALYLFIIYWIFLRKEKRTVDELTTKTI